MSTSDTSWHQFFMQHARLAATRSKCLRRHVGAVIVRDRYILAGGYNGPPKGVSHCVYPADPQDPRICPRLRDNIPSGTKIECCRGLHAEQNAIIQAAFVGVSVKDSVIYCTHSPCITCLKMVINAGIRTIYYAESYPDSLSEQMAQEAHVSLILLEP